jgi:hypothetical protein
VHVAERVESEVEGLLEVVGENAEKSLEVQTGGGKGMTGRELGREIFKYAIHVLDLGDLIFAIKDLHVNFHLEYSFLI